jgi:DNA repair exonuclease SbcCD ATPase subunit
VTERQTPQPVVETQQPGQGEADMNELDQLKKQLADKEAELSRVTGEKAALAKAVAPVIEGLKSIPDVKLPEREVLPAEVAERVNALETQVRDLTAQRDAAVVESKKALDTVTAERDQLKAQFANAERIQKVVAAAKPILADSAYAKALKLAIAQVVESNPAFTAEQVEAFIEAKSKEYDLVNGGKRPAPAKKEKAPAKPANGFVKGALNWDDDQIAQHERAQTARAMCSPRRSAARLLPRAASPRPKKTMTNPARDDAATHGSRTGFDSRAAF